LRASGRRALRYLAAGIAIALSASGCESGIGSRSVRLPPAFDRTGTLRSDGFFQNMTQVAAVSTGDTGDIGGGSAADNLELRGFVSVSLSPIPAGATVTKVVLELQGSVPFANVFGDFGALHVDHIDVVGGISLDDFDEDDVLAEDFTNISSLPLDGSSMTVEIDITKHVQADLAAGRPISSFRFRFNGAPSADLQHDVAAFDAFPDFADQQPFATATYQP
jgi:hypothetical protein